MYCAITSQPINVDELWRRVRRDADGAILVFTGVVRDQNEGRRVVRLSYTAYEEMAERKLTSICEEVAEQFDVGDIAVVHRAVKLAAVAGLSNDRHAESLELFRHGFGFLATLQVFGLDV